MLTIGFTTTFYTLWDVNTYQKWGQRDGKPYSYMETSHQYLRNLSMDLDDAKAKVQAVIGDRAFSVDLNLRGKSWFVTTEEIRDPEPPKDYTFTFGRFKGSDIRAAGNSQLEEVERRMREIEAQILLDGADNALSHESRESVTKFHLKDIIWQLERAMRQESTSRRKVYARRRLIELGALVRRDWIEKYPIHDANADFTAPIKYGEIKRKWMPKGLAKWHDTIGSKKGLWYADKERVTLVVKELKTKMVDTDYGVMYIVNYEDQNGHVITYKGGSPLRIDGAETVAVKATIKHNRNETFIQRLKAV